MMTPKKRLFVDEYLVDRNATQAATRAGYSPKTARAQGSRLLLDVDILAAIAKSETARQKRTEVTQDYVVTRLRENVERAMQVEAVRDKEGNETGEYRYEGSVANGALTLLGKHLGMFVERAEVNVSNLAPDERLDRLGSIFQAARQRQSELSS